MKIYTSYFGNLKKLYAANIVPIGIAVFPPKWYKGQSIIALAPTREMVVKTGNGSMLMEQYDMLYKEMLANKNPQQLFDMLKQKFEGKDVALLCYETERKECHRDMTANWIEEHLEIKVVEFGIVKENQLSLSL